MTAVSEPLVRFDAITKSYGSHRALDTIDLSLPRNRFIGLLGPNGAGKTTLISILCAILQPDDGTVRLQAEAGDWVDPVKARAFVGLVPQELAFYPTLSVQENLSFFGSMHGLRGRKLRDAIADAVRIGRLEHTMTQRAETLSGGLKRRLDLAIGVIHRPRLLVLDEPTAGVDAQSRHFLQQELKRLNAQGTTIVYTSHYLEEVEVLCDALVVIDQGRVVAQGPVDALLQQDSLNLRMGSPVPARFDATLRTMPGLHAVRREGELITMTADVPQLALADVLHAAEATGAVIAQATIGARSLETFFFQLTGTRLRDSAEPGGPDS